MPHIVPIPATGHDPKRLKRPASKQFLYGIQSHGSNYNHHAAKQAKISSEILIHRHDDGSWSFSAAFGLRGGGQGIVGPGMSGISHAQVLANLEIRR